ncbi:YhcB family protein [Endozoicomonadaceae bacterium StTr2]
MEEQTNLLLIVGIAAFSAGLLIGALFYHLFSGSAAQRGKMKSELDEVKEQLKEYQEKVTDHFAKTATLVNRMTENYREINEHLANTAEDLCTDDVTRHKVSDALLSSQTLANGRATKAENADSIEPPKDYAPKNGNQQEGTLSEEFAVKQSS